MAKQNQPGIVFAAGARPGFGLAFRAAPQFPWEWQRPSFAQLEVLATAEVTDREALHDLDRRLHERVDSLLAHFTRAEEQLSRYFAQHLPVPGFQRVKLLDSMGKLEDALPKLWPDAPADVVAVLEQRERLKGMLEKDRQALAFTARILAKKPTTFLGKLQKLFDS
jgi:hypothetical protein